MATLMLGISSMFSFHPCLKSMSVESFKGFFSLSSSSNGRRVRCFMLCRGCMMISLVLCAPPPLVWYSVLLCVWSLKGDCCLISDDLSYSCTFYRLNVFRKWSRFSSLLSITKSITIGAWAIVSKSWIYVKSRNWLEINYYFPWVEGISKYFFFLFQS